MYSPGNSVIVNLCMRFPAIAVVAALCGGAYYIEKKVTEPSPPPVVHTVPVIVAPVDPQIVIVPPTIQVPTPVMKIVSCPRGTVVKHGKCVHG